MIELLLQAERALSVGLIDQAETLYWRAIENDPRNSIAVVGLARVALERGDDRTAYLWGRKALDLDGENVAAQRLVARLSEVMAHRGERVPEPSEGPELPIELATTGVAPFAPATTEPATAEPAAPEPTAPEPAAPEQTDTGRADLEPTGSQPTGPLPAAPEPTGPLRAAPESAAPEQPAPPARKKGLLRRLIGRG